MKGNTNIMSLQLKILTIFCTIFIVLNYGFIRNLISYRKGERIECKRFMFEYLVGIIIMTLIYTIWDFSILLFVEYIKMQFIIGLIFNFLIGFTLNMSCTELEQYRLYKKHDKFRLKISKLGIRYAVILIAFYLIFF